MKTTRRVEQWAFLLLAVFVFSIPFEKTIQAPGFGTAARLLGLLAFGAALVTVLLRRRLRELNLALLLAAVFVLWGVLTCLWSIAPGVSADRARTFVQLLAMAWVIWELCRTAAQQRILLAAYVAGAVVASAGTVLRYALRQQTYYRRYAAAGFDPNDLGLTVALSIPMALYLAMVLSRRWRWLCWLAIAAAEVAVLLSGSRTALVASVLGFAFAFWRWRELDIANRVAAVALLVLLGLGLVRLAPEHSRQRLATLPTELAHGTIHNRTRIWKTGLRSLKQFPIRGAGVGAYPEAVRPWLGRPDIPGHEYVAHNAFLSVLVEQGMPGAALFGLLLATLAVFAWMLPDRERALYLVLLAVWAVGVATLTWEHRKPSWLLFALIMTAWSRAFREPA